jgi:CheY-like chemotaxis protein
MNRPRYTILLVEDDSNDVFLIQRAFRKANPVAPIHVMGDGDEAVAYLTRMASCTDPSAYWLPRLMLLDLKLPRKSGMEVLTWLRQQPELRRLPVVVLTSSRETSDINQAYDLGANSYLVKPVDFEALLDMVNTLNCYWMNLNEMPELPTRV